MNKKTIQNIIISKFEQDRDLSRLLITEDNLEIVLEALSDGIADVINKALEEWEKELIGKMR